jgi:hypothetical protein
MPSISTSSIGVKNTVICCYSFTTSFLLLVVGVQWILLTILQLYRSDAGSSDYQITFGATSTPVDSMNIMHLPQGEDRSVSSSSLVLDGVAVTIMYRAPKWFHVRYKVMIDNAIMNLPNQTTWKVQIFINPNFFHDQNVLDWNPGLQQYMNGQHPQVIVTPLPSNLTSPKSKPKDVLYSSWFWNSIISDRVLLFSGNGAFCGNQVISNVWSDNQLYDLDYLGVPSNTFDGNIGGDGSTHSYRNRRSMLRIIDYRNKHGISTFHHPEDHETLKAMIQINKEKSDKNFDGSFTPFKIASKEQTIVFGGVYDLINNVTEGLVRLPLVVSGTHPRLTFQERDVLLKHCPELKIIFPSLHEPACFGARPKPDICKASICALQDKISSHGC